MEGEVHKLFVQKLPWLWCGAWYTVLWAGRGLAFYSVLSYLRPLLCAQIYGNCAFSAIKPVDQHWSYVWEITSQMALAHAQKPFDFTFMSLYGSWWLPCWNQATICVTTALEAPFETLFQALYKDNETYNCIAKPHGEGKYVFILQTWHWVFFLALLYKWKVSGKKGI